MNMRAQSPVAAILACIAGGIETVTERCGIGEEAIKKWHQAGRIPPKHWPALIELGEGEITLAMLSGQTMPAGAAPVPADPEKEVA
jgi:carbamoyl-phosphate synthase small subunit